MAIQDINNPLASGELAKGSGIHRPGSPGGPAKTNERQRVSRTETDNQVVQGTSAERTGDTYESTETLRLAAELTNRIEITDPEPREDVVNNARERVRNGYYNSAEFANRLATRLINTGTVR